MPRKLWISETQSIDLADVGQSKTMAGELATRNRSIDFTSLAGYLPDPDPILRKQGKDMSIYRDLITDAHVWSCVQSRKAGVLSLEWEIDRGKGKSRPAKIIEELLTHLDLNAIMSEILDAPLYGFQPIEIIWSKLDQYVLPERIAAKPAEWFVYDNENKLRLRTKAQPTLGEEIPENKFLVPQSNASYSNPYGERTLSRCFWPVTFKRGGFKFWVIFAEKYGIPFLIGKHPRGTGKEDIDHLADMLERMVQDAVAVVPDDSSVEILEAEAKNSSSNIFKDLLDWCNAEISKAIVGQTLTTQVGESGSYAASKTHQEVRKDIIDADKKIVEKTINQLIARIYNYNFTGTPPTFGLYEEEQVDQALADRDKKLTDSGVKFTKKYYQRAYGFEEDDFEVGAIKPPKESEPPSQFAEAQGTPRYPDQVAIDAAAESLSIEALQKQMDGALKPVIEMIQSGSTYADVLENLLDTYPTMKTDAVEEMLARAIFVAEAWGRINA